MGDRLSINVFCNEGVSIVETERGKVSISASEFLAGWQGKPGAKKTTPPFGQSELHVKEALDAGTYEVAVWRNDEVRARWNDASGKRWNVIVERDGKMFQRDGDPVPPAEAERENLIYLNLSVKPQQQREPHAAAAPPASTPPAKGRFD